jgi:hypothetical protein
VLSFLARSGLPTVVLLLGALALVILSLLQASRKRELLERHYQILAARLRGRFEPAGFFSNATIQFPLADRPAVIDFQGGKQPHTHLRVWLPRNPGGSLKISRDSIAQIFISAMDGRRFRVGDSLFDKTFAVRSYPETLGQKIFSPGRRQEAMTAVRRLNSCFGPSIEVQPSWMEVRIRELADSPDVALAMVRTAADFMRFLYGVEPEPGIVWGPVTESLSGRCPICTSTLAEPLVRCSRCLTPHHQDCWTYLGRCSTYGCEPRPERRVG